MTKKIAILWHENDRMRIQNFEISTAAKVWKADGFDVINVFGVNHFIPADLAILHVDLSIVPDEFFEFAEQYPVVLNKGVKDIRKSTFSDHRIYPNDKYNGKVIVKSNLNHAGLPERRLDTFTRRQSIKIRSRLCSNFQKDHISFNSPFDYLILDSPGLIPQAWYGREDLIIEKFVPEMSDGHYWVRNYYFIGEGSLCIRKKSIHPIVNRLSTIGVEFVDVHPKIVEARKKLNFDYGKFDYVIHDDEPVLLDINKTPGGSPDADYVDSVYRRVMSSVYSYFS